jgi:hypothetical protein
MDKVTDKLNIKKNNWIDIKNDIIDLNNLIDEKFSHIYEINENNREKIEKYNTMMENIIFEYHNVCKKMITNNN